MSESAHDRYVRLHRDADDRLLRMLDAGASLEDMREEIASTRTVESRREEVVEEISRRCFRLEDLDASSRGAIFEAIERAFDEGRKFSIEKKEVA